MDTEHDNKSTPHLPAESCCALNMEQSTHVQMAATQLPSSSGDMQWRATFDSIRDIVLIIDKHFRITRANQAAAQFFRMPAEQIIGTHCHLLMHGTVEPSPDCPLAKAAQTKQHEEEEVFDETRNAWYLAAVDPICGSDSTRGLAVHTIRDITERKRVEQALLESELLKRDILSSLASHIAVVDRRGTIIAVNDAWRNFCRDNGGDESTTCIGANYLEILKRSIQTGDPQAREVLAGIHAVLDSTVAHFRYEYSCSTAGTQQWFLLTVTPLRRSQGGAVVEHANITELKLAQGSLEDALSEIRRLKDRFEAENAYLREEAQQSEVFGDIIGQSDALQRVLAQVARVATTDATVLLLGETGTGKDVLARAIHSRSLRKDKPFVSLNCAALPASLIEAELFGHEKGAFTGAIGTHVGRFELADGGTLLLDEVGEMAPELQAKLLRVLQEGTFERVGSSRTMAVDVRILAATNRDLQQAVQQGRFRADLYYRLNVFPICVPPLRQRRQDIPLLVQYFISLRQRRLNRKIEQIPPRTMTALMEYDWPGNIRELENIVEHAMIISSGPVLELDESFLIQGGSIKPALAGGTLEDMEYSHILNVLETCNWKVKGQGNAADRLGLKPSTLYFRMKKLGIVRPQS